MVVFAHGLYYISAFDPNALSALPSDPHSIRLSHGFIGDAAGIGGIGGITGGIGGGSGAVSQGPTVVTGVKNNPAVWGTVSKPGVAVTQGTVSVPVPVEYDTPIQITQPIQLQAPTQEITTQQTWTITPSQDNYGSYQILNDDYPITDWNGGLTAIGPDSDLSGSDWQIIPADVPDQYQDLGLVNIVGDDGMAWYAPWQHDSPHGGIDQQISFRSLPAGPIKDVTDPKWAPYFFKIQQATTSTHQVTTSHQSGGAGAGAVTGAGAGTGLGLGLGPHSVQISAALPRDVANANEQIAAAN